MVMMVMMKNLFCLFGYDILATSFLFVSGLHPGSIQDHIIMGTKLTTVHTHEQLFSAVPLGDKATSTMT